MEPYLSQDSPYQAYKEQIMEAGRRLWLRGLVAANDGNISCRVAGGYLITASGRSKGFLQPQDILLLDGEGRVCDGNPAPPSIETGLHLALYQARPEVGAVVHAHPPAATAFALAGTDINLNAPDEVKLQLGRVALIPHGEAGSPELARNAAQALAAPDLGAGLLLRHGAVALGQDIMKALFRLEALEQAARIMLAARLLQG